MIRFMRWYHRRQFTRAYNILKKTSERHKKANHLTDFEAIDESYILLRCTACPDKQV